MCDLISYIDKVYEQSDFKIISNFISFIGRTIHGCCKACDNEDRLITHRGETKTYALRASLCISNFPT